LCSVFWQSSLITPIEVGIERRAPERRQPVKGPIRVRLQPRHLKALDAWIAKQKPQVTHPEAIRALLSEALEVEDLG